MRVFMAHPKAWSDDQINSVRDQLSTKMSLDIGEKVHVIAGRDDFNDNIYSAGNFSGWIRDVVGRINSQSRKPFYDVFVAVSENIGKATRDILLTARRSRPIFFYDVDTDNIRQILSVEEVDADDMVNGWVIDHAEIS